MVDYANELKNETVRDQLTPRSSIQVGYWTELVLGRALPAIIYTPFLVGKMLLSVGAAQKLIRAGPGARLDDWFNALNQSLTMIYLTLLMVLFVVRLRRRSGLRQPHVIVVAFFGTFSLLLAAVLPAVPARDFMILPSLVVSALGLIYTIWSLGWLGRSFSIMPEARRLVRRGPYSMSRHPLYFGEGVAGVSLLLPTAALPTILLLGAFLAAQYARVRWEEQVLRAEFPTDYEEYSGQVPRFIPRPWLFRP